MKIWRWVALGCWLAALASGVYLLSAHQFTPGARGVVLHRWTEPGPTDRPRLVMFVHPQCPCTPASLRNFATAAEGAGCDATIYVVAEDPARTPNGRASAQLRAVETRPDPDGVIARRFGARTSGHVFLYATDGRLVFEGGITDGRGHEGDSPGLRAVAARLSGTEDEPVSFPVFGCALQQ